MKVQSHSTLSVYHIQAITFLLEGGQGQRGFCWECDTSFCFAEDWDLPSL